MNRSWAILGFVILVFTGNFLPAQGDKKLSLEGTWKPVKFTVDGREDTIEDGTVLVFTKKTLEVRKDDDIRIKATIKIDPTKKPAHIDLSFSQGPENFTDKTGKGIYLLKGKTLTLAMKEPGLDERPTEFKSGDGSKIYLVVLERVKE